MPFSFGFAGDDIDAGEAAEVAASMISIRQDERTQTSLPARRHNLEEMLSVLPSHLLYNYLNIPLLLNNAASDVASSAPLQKQHLSLPRRDLFDIRAQLMAESLPGENLNDDLISGLDAGDLRSGFYEGGFKTWECAIDLAGFLQQTLSLNEDEDWHIIELGAGSAIPSLGIFAKILKRKVNGNEKFLFTFCDYNEDVLRLATLPNMLLTWWEMGGKSEKDKKMGSQCREAEMEDIDQTLTKKFTEDCRERGIFFDFVSGAWGGKIVDLIELPSIEEMPGTRKGHLVIIASETIYDPSSLAAFAETVMGLLRKANGDKRAFLATKKVYFGVGGGMEDFIQEIYRRGGAVNQVLDNTEAGVGRVIIEVLLS